MSAEPRASWAGYYRQCLVAPEVVARVEEVVVALPAASRVSAEDVRRRIGHGVTLDQVVEVLSAIEAAGLATWGEGMRWEPNNALYTTARERQRAREAVVQTWETCRHEEPVLLLSAPGEVAESRFRSQFGNLRTAVRALIAGSERELTLAAPFWDLDVAEDLAPLLERRLAAGVNVRLITRLPQGGSNSDRAIVFLARIGVGEKRCDVRVIDQPSTSDRFGRETFHFKMISADSATVYVGSANFDTAGLASRWELGVLLRGRAARVISELVGALGDGAPRFGAP